VSVAGLPDASTKQGTVPEGAIRPLGTLHLTLGVMSLSTKERLGEALRFFQSLDLASLMREAERVASKSREKSRVRSSTDNDSGDIESPEAASETPRALDPLCVSLESLHCLPRANAATVLHASPVDPTGRLYPFCLMLRDKFLEAGFIQDDTKVKQKDDNKGVQNEQIHIESEVAPESSDPYTAALVRNAKTRPLLLHATVVNTIYIRGRPKPQPGASNPKKGKNGSKRLEFDARGIVARYRNYYVDEARTIPRVGTNATCSEDTGVAENETSSGKIVSAESAPQYPFVWAKDIPIDSVCICEMGAKKLSLDSEDAILNARMGEKYTVIAERSLEAPWNSTSARPGSVGSDGGVKLS